MVNQVTYTLVSPAEIQAFRLDGRVSKPCKELEMLKYVVEVKASNRSTAGFGKWGHPGRN